MSSVPTRVCLKKQNLQSLGYNDLKEWVYTKNNIYITKNKEKYVKGVEIPSKWENLYSEWEYGKETSLHLYEEKVRNDTHLINSLKYLSGRNLGCWCSEDEPCHGDILIKLYNEYCLVKDGGKKKESSIEEKNVNRKKKSATVNQ